MAQFLQAQAAPIPRTVLSNAHQALPRLAAAKARAVIAPHCDLAGNLFYRGLFQGIDIVGALDRNPDKIGRSIFNLDIYTYEAIERLDLDAIIVANTRYHDAVVDFLTPTAKRLGIELIDLCAGYDSTAFRRELAEALDYRALLRQRPIEGDLPRTVAVTVPAGWGFGDKLCALSAARAFARRHPECAVQFNLFPEVVEAYPDRLVSTGRNAMPLPENSALFHREKHSSPAGNYLGCYYLGLGLDFDENPSLDLPPVPPLPGLMPGSYIALQPRAKWAQPNLARDVLQQIADGCALPVVQVGQPDPEYRLDRVDASRTGDEITMLRAIRHAALVLTPRSASVHIASGYKVPTVVWVPDDGENWHLDYPNWPNRQIPVATSDIASQVLSAAADLIGRR